MKILNKCPLCKSNNIKYSLTGKDLLYKISDHEYPIFACDNCSAMFLNPFPSAEQTSQFYPKSYYSYETSHADGFFEKVRKNIVEYHLNPKNKLSLIDKFFVFIFRSKFSGIPLYKKKGGKFLDIGCGIGSNLKLLNSYGWETHGIEIDENAVKHARKNGLNVTKNTIENVDFGINKFDCIRLWHVLEHLTNPISALNKIKLQLSPNGEILIAVPNTNSFAKKLFRNYWYSLDTPRHVINYSSKTIQYLCQKNQLKISKIQYSSAASFLGGISHLLRSHLNFEGNLVNNYFLLILLSPLDFISDMLHQGDTIFVKITHEKKETA